MPKYEVLFEFVAPSHYKGSVVQAEDLGDDDRLAVLRKLKAVRELTEEEAAQIEIDERELSDGDGIAYNAQGINVAPDAPPQPDLNSLDPGSLAARTAKKATTATAIPGTTEPNAQAAADKAAADTSE